MPTEEEDRLTEFRLLEEQLEPDVTCEDSLLDKAVVQRGELEVQDFHAAAIFYLYI